VTLRLFLLTLMNVIIVIVVIVRVFNELIEKPQSFGIKLYSYAC